MNARCDHTSGSNRDGPNNCCSPAPDTTNQPDGSGDALDAYNEYAKLFERSFITTVRQPVTSAGRTHADNVNASVRSKLAASGTATESSTPSNDNAPP